MTTRYVSPDPEALRRSLPVAWRALASDPRTETRDGAGPEIRKILADSVPPPEREAAQP